MKCVCGYEYNRPLAASFADPAEIKGDQEFIIVNVYGYRYGPNRPVNVCACPKCGTLRLEP